MSAGIILTLIAERDVARQAARKAEAKWRDHWTTLAKDEQL